jgi:hypothetical protein
MASSRGLNNKTVAVAVAVAVQHDVWNGCFLILTHYSRAITIPQIIIAACLFIQYSIEHILTKYACAKYSIYGHI